MAVPTYFFFHREKRAKKANEPTKAAMPNAGALFDASTAVNAANRVMANTTPRAPRDQARLGRTTRTIITIAMLAKAKIVFVIAKVSLWT